MTHEKPKSSAEFSMEDSENALPCVKFAEATVISVPMVRKLIKMGQLRAVRIGRCVRIPKTELLRILDQGTRGCRK